MVHKAIEASKSLENDGYEVGVIDLYRLKPINANLLIKLLGNTTELLIVEDNIASGGLSEKINSILMNSNLNITTHACNASDKHFFNYHQKREFIESQNGLSTEHIIEIINEL